MSNLILIDTTKRNSNTEIPFVYKKDTNLVGLKCATRFTFFLGEKILYILAL